MKGHPKPTQVDEDDLIAWGHGKYVPPDPEACEVGTMDFEDPALTVRLGTRYVPAIHPFMLDDLELIDILKLGHAIDAVHDETILLDAQEWIAQYAKADADATLKGNKHDWSHERYQKA